MEITATQVKELRDRTGIGMMDCKGALVEAEGDIDKAIDWLLKGAVPTDTVRDIFSKHGVMERFDKAKRKVAESIPEEEK